MTEHTQKIDNLQILRGVAAIMVVLYHVAVFNQQILHENFLFGLFRFGFSGVDIFFVLSGFIIAYAHHQDIGKSDRLRSYLIKRITRIYPIYWFITLSVIPLYFFLPQYGTGYERELGSIVKSLLLVPQNHFPVVAVAWTLIHEVRFYILFSLLVYFGFKRILPLLFIIISLSFYSLVTPALKLPYSDSLLFNYLFSYFNIEFFLGCFSFYLVRRANMSGYIFFLFGIASFVGGIWYLSLHTTPMYATSPESIRVILFGIPAFLLVTSLSSSSKLHSNNFFTGNVFIKIFSVLFLALGNASYSLYLSHQILIAIFGRIFSSLNLNSLLGSMLFSFLIFLLVVGLGYLLHLYIEKPLLVKSRKTFETLLKLPKILT